MNTINKTMTKFILEEYIKQSVDYFEIIAENNNSIVSVYKTNGSKRVLKQDKNGLSLKEEFKNYLFYQRSSQKNIKFPKVFNYYQEYNAFDMEFLEGHTISELIAKNNFEKFDTFPKILKKFHEEENITLQYRQLDNDYFKRVYSSKLLKEKQIISFKNIFEEIKNFKFNF